MSGVIALLVTSLSLGVLARRVRAFPENTASGINAVVLYVALPALVLRAIHSVPLEPSLLWAAAMLWLQFGVAIGVFKLLGRFAKLSRGTVGALVLTAGLSNTAFVGLPVIEAVLGPEALGVGVVVDQLGSFLVMATVGIAFAAHAAGGRGDPRAQVRRVVLFPPFIALVAAFVLRPLSFPGWVEVTLTRLGDLLTPLALFSVGFQLQLRGLRAHLGALGAGLTFKLVVSPVLFALVLSGFIPPGTVAWEVTVLQCAMPPMVTGGILAAQHELNPPLAAAMVGVGIPLSALTLALTIAALHAIG